MTFAGELCPEVSSHAKGSNIHKDELPRCLKLASAANALESFKDPARSELRDVSRVSYLADNAGELYFDLSLVKHIEQFARVTYVIKPSPMQNDLTLEDVTRSGLEAQFGRVMSTGVASPGIVFALASADFRREFESADLIFAKGMGHYEALSEFPSSGRFFYCLRAKCQPVADSLRVPMNSYVAMLQ